MLGHPNKAGTSEFSGCATWENKPRARLYLGLPKADDDAEVDLNDPRRVLSRSKANLASRDALDLVWRDGVFRVADPRFMTAAEKCDASARQAAIREAIFAAIDIYQAAGITTSDSHNATNYLVRKMLDTGQCAFKKRELSQTLAQLVLEGRIHKQAIGRTGSGRNLQHTLVRVG
jgi:hypothetical protein